MWFTYITAMTERPPEIWSSYAIAQKCDIVYTRIYDVCAAAAAADGHCRKRDIFRTYRGGLVEETGGKIDYADTA